MEALEQVFTPDFSYPALLQVDGIIGGPGITTIHHVALGEADLEDRPIFRPLWYCEHYFAMFELASWTARSVVHMSGLHLESLLKRLGGEWTEHMPLGRLIRERRIEHVLGTTTAVQVRAFAHLYNSAKHDIPVDDDRPLFTQRESVMAYVVSRKLAALLYPHVKLSVALERFEAR